MAAKYMAPDQLRQYTDATIGTPLLPRDLIIATLYNTLAAFVLEDGRKLYPMPARTAVSESLDAIAQSEGDFLRRGANGWEGVPAIASDVLGAVVRRPGTQAVGAGYQLATYTTEIANPNGLYDPAVPNRITSPVEGWAAILFSAEGQTNTSQNTGLSIAKNGIWQTMTTHLPSSIKYIGWRQCAWIIPVAPDDYIQGNFWSTAGGITWNYATLGVMILPT